MEEGGSMATIVAAITAILGAMGLSGEGVRRLYRRQATTETLLSTHLKAYAKMEEQQKEWHREQTEALREMKGELMEAMGTLSDKMDRTTTCLHSRVTGVEVQVAEMRGRQEGH